MSTQHSQQTAFGMPASGLAMRRGGPAFKPLAVDPSRAANVNDNGVPTPRTSRSHLLAGLRTAPKSATASSFPASATATMAPQSYSWNKTATGGYTNNDNGYAAPKTALPRFATQQHQQHQQQQQQQQQAEMAALMHLNQLYSVDQVLAPPAIESVHQMDQEEYNQRLAANAMFKQQQINLQQQVQALEAQMELLQMNAAARATLIQQQQQQQQQQAIAMQNSLGYQQLNTISVANSMATPQQNVFAYLDPVTNQMFYVEASPSAMTASYSTQQQMQMQQLAQQQQYMQPYQSVQQPKMMSTPRVQVSPPPGEKPISSSRNASPPRRLDTIAEPTPLPPPSANAFRRGHKKASSLANIIPGLPAAGQEPPKSAGPRTAQFPITPAGTYGPGQGRAGEHAIRQPRGPPSFDELRSKPTAKHDGSKNFATRTRRSAVVSVRANLERRKGASSPTTMSPVSESAEEMDTPVTDNDSDSGRSGSGSLCGEADASLASSRTSTSGSWGAIGSNRPNSRQQPRKSIDSVDSMEQGIKSSFAGVFKAAQEAKANEATDGQRRAPMLVLTSAEKRKGSITPVAH